MKTEIELPPLPDGWADGPVEIGYGVPPLGSMVLTSIGWDKSTGSTVPFVYAAKKWVPAIVTAKMLWPCWIVIDPDGNYCCGESKPVWHEDEEAWVGARLHYLCVREIPQIKGRNAIWEIK